MYCSVIFCIAYWWLKVCYSFVNWLENTYNKICNLNLTFLITWLTRLQLILWPLYSVTRFLTCYKKINTKKRYVEKRPPNVGTLILNIVSKFLIRGWCIFSVCQCQVLDSFPPYLFILLKYIHSIMSTQLPYPRFWNSKQKKQIY